MSSTSFFAELVKSRENARKLQEVMAKDEDSGKDSNKDSTESAKHNGNVAEEGAQIHTSVNDAGVITIIDSTESTPHVTVAPSHGSSQILANGSSNQGRPHDASSVNKEFSQAAPIVVDTQRPPPPITTPSANNTTPAGTPSVGKRLAATNLTKLPLPPGISLEDIESPPSPSTPATDAEKNKKTRISITKDLPMPPGKF